MGEGHTRLNDLLWRAALCLALRSNMGHRDAIGEASTLKNGHYLVGTRRDQAPASFGPVSACTYTYAHTHVYGQGCPQNWARGLVLGLCFTRQIGRAHV